MRDIRKLTEEEIAKVKLMAHDHPFYEVAMAMYDCTLLGEVPLLGYTAQNFFLDVIYEAENFFLETETGGVAQWSLKNCQSWSFTLSDPP